ncbi:MAG: pyridoxamine 5'-phosphate oxidase family protein [Chloroflexi bacterium]|nr:pyridoxamine 5'-phosphate oxidase family protein [Chloroflexota bacterium]MDL1942361.1 pyridoxamine 5'-phosphate oxidase family protein [Chloroflexi bacterium CFX2]
MPRDYQGQPPTAFQRLPEYERGDDWIKALLHRGEIAHIASRWDLQPFLTPTTYFYDEANHRIIFHSNIAGRIRANIERHPEVCVEVSEFGKLLPSNIALEFSLQYRSVIVFGKARVIENDDEKRTVLHKLVHKYFGAMKIDRDYRSATDRELKRTSVYEIQIESWSGKENWKDAADQSGEWAPLDEKWFDYYRNKS